MVTTMNPMLLKDKTIFIVEDNAQNRVIFQMSLLRYGAVIDFERWGASTVARLDGLPRIDLIILDLQLADGISGIDLYDQIRALPKYINVPIIAVSAMDPAVAVPKVRAKGFSGFIAKPIDRFLFPTQLAEIIQGKQIWHTGQRDYSV
jgi:CheY-like chemotaxis protein